jgi:hypothetical protein
MGARNAAWHDAMVHVAGLTNEALDLRYAQYRADYSRRDDGGAIGTFWSIGRFAYDPAKVYSEKGTNVKKNMSVYGAVGRDPEFAHINSGIYDQGLWRLLSRPQVADAELQTIITTALRQKGLFRPQDGDRMLGRQFLRDKSAFDYAGPDQMQDAFFSISSWHNVASLTLLAALSREYLRLGAFEYIGLLQFEFEHCLQAVTFKYGFSRSLELLIHWLAAYRIFSNRWDDDIPNDESREHALAKINSDRGEQGQKPLAKYDFWVEALAVRYHGTYAVHRYAPVPMTPQLQWMEDHRARLAQAFKDWDHGQETPDLWSPLF